MNFFITKNLIRRGKGLFAVALLFFLGSVACSGPGGGTVDSLGGTNQFGPGGGGPGGGGGAASPGTVTPIADVTSTPTGDCFDKAGHLIPCAKAYYRGPKRDEEIDYRLSGKDTSNKYQVLSRNYKEANPFRINKEGALSFLLETNATYPGGTPIWRTPEEGGPHIYIVVFPPEGSKDGSRVYNMTGSILDSIITIDKDGGGAHNLVFNGVSLHLGDRVELWRYREMDTSPSAKIWYLGYPGCKDDHCTLDEAAFTKFVENGYSEFLATFNVMEDFKNMEVKPTSTPRTEGLDGILD